MGEGMPPALATWLALEGVTPLALWTVFALAVAALSQVRCDAGAQADAQAVQCNAMPCTVWSLCWAPRCLRRWVHYVHICAHAVRGWTAGCCRSWLSCDPSCIHAPPSVPSRPGPPPSFVSFRHTQSWPNTLLLQRTACPPLALLARVGAHGGPATCRQATHGATGRQGRTWRHRCCPLLHSRPLYCTVSRFRVLVAGPTRVVISRSEYPTTSSLASLAAAVVALCCIWSMCHRLAAQHLCLRLWRWQPPDCRCWPQLLLLQFPGLAALASRLACSGLWSPGHGAGGGGTTGCASTQCVMRLTPCWWW
jgi:hypothetical protein